MSYVFEALFPSHSRCTSMDWKYFMQLLPYMKAFQGEGGNITYSSLHTVALKNRLINNLMATMGALPLLWSEDTLGSWVVLCASAGDWLHAASLVNCLLHTLLHFSWSHNWRTAKVYPVKPSKMCMLISCLCNMLLRWEALTLYLIPVFWVLHRRAVYSKYHLA